MRFNLGEVWKSTSGLRAVVIRIIDDGRSGLLFFEDGFEREFKWMELTGGGRWQVDPSPKPTKSAPELEGLVLNKMSQHPVCPMGMGVKIRAQWNGKWKMDAVPPAGCSIGYADCAHYIGTVAQYYSLLFALQ
jgi:hypothetical protein